MASSLAGNRRALETLDVRRLVDVCAMLKVELLMMGYMLERVLITRDHLRRHQEVLCEFVTAILVVETHDAHPKMRFSLSPPPPKVSLTSTASSAIATASAYNNNNNNNSSSSKRSCQRKVLPQSRNRSRSRSRNNNDMLSSTIVAGGDGSADEALSDYNQWLHAMKLVARLPGGTPPEFRRKLWLSLADKYLKSKNVDWAKQREKCFCEEWREDDEELGIQIVKDLHRTGSNLCTGPAASINQAKLKRILLGYARYNPEVGYCQGFNMLGALILQVMDKEEEESMKVMIYLVEGVLPTGYFCGSMGGLQADMGVFRELMQVKLPRLAKHLQRLQGPLENAYEPPLTNVFTMQWFLTMFCTCLPMSCVLRVWDLVLIEGSDVLLRTALVLWSLLEERILIARTADEFYGKMGSFSNELLNGHLIDSNGLIEKVVQLGPIADIKQLRSKHLYNVTPLANKQGLQLYYDEEDTHSDDESRLAVATVWGLNWGRRGSVGAASSGAGKPQTEQKDRLALDISLLKKQYDRLRERQKQAHVILTSACSTATVARQTPSNQLPVNRLLLGRPAIVTNKGKRVGAPMGAIPPARKPSLPAVLHSKPPAAGERRELRRGETLLWRDTDATRQRRDSLTWKEIKADRAALVREGLDASAAKSQKLRSRLGRSDSSSYSEDSDGEQEDGGKDGSSSDTSLCDDDDPKSTEQSPKRKAKLARKRKNMPQPSVSLDASIERRRPKSWAPSTHEIPFMLMGPDSADEKESAPKEDEDSATECDRLDWSKASGDLALDKQDQLAAGLPSLSLPASKPDYVMSDTESVNPVENLDEKHSLPVQEKTSLGRFDVNDDGVTNEYFERVNSVERPKRLELSYSLNTDDAEEACPKKEEEDRRLVEGHSAGYVVKAMPGEHDPFADIPLVRDDNIPGENKDDYKELLNMTIDRSHSVLQKNLSSASQKRRDPRRKTLTRSSTVDIEERFLAMERQLNEVKLTRHSDKLDSAKYIPTTESLEERYNTLEKQLSAESKPQASKEHSAECFDKPERIPSTVDLEMRFNALAKQMSSSETNSKAPLNLNESKQPPDSGSKEASKDGNVKEGNILNESQTDAIKPASRSETSANSKRERPESEGPRLKKLPSTAELEDRFNALERRISVQKNSPTKAKKEPPDDSLEGGQSQEAIIQEENKNRKEERMKSDAAPKETPLVKATQNGGTEARHNSTPTKETQATPGKKEAKVDTVDRKAPPSTEELEKRFNALERHLSTTKSESREEETQIPTVPRTEEKEIEADGEGGKAREEKTDEQRSEVSKASTEAREAVESTCSKEVKATKLGSETDAESELDAEANPADPDSTQRTKRRASEPPSMEDLETRYARLKRRMSSKSALATQSETVNEALDRIEQEVIAELENLADEPTSIKREPPTTEDLESRYEALHGGAKRASQAEPVPGHVDVAIEARIPEAPPLPPPERRVAAIEGQHQQRALIEELQSKIQAQSPGEENLKPSEINPQRKRQPEQRQLQQRPKPMGDETSEAPANTAYYRSGNYEPWQSQRMVRRFSDLPSRADLENRLQFLEKKLYKQFYKQRSASDSEVASRTATQDEKPCTSHQAAQLEQRVLALEKQLSENSLKLLEAIREKGKEQEKTSHNSVELCSPRRLSTDMEVGKELVRYTQNITESEESDKPINISINIKMLLNKEIEPRRPHSESSSEDLRLRLEQLESQISETRARNGASIPDCELQVGEVGLPAGDQGDESESCKKEEKDSHNLSVRCEETEALEEHTLPSPESIKPETAKETKTMRNTEKPRSAEKDTARCEVAMDEHSETVNANIPIEEKCPENNASPSVGTQINRPTASPKPDEAVKNNASPSAGTQINRPSASPKSDEAVKNNASPSAEAQVNPPTASPKPDEAANPAANLDEAEEKPAPVVESIKHSEQSLVDIGSADANNKTVVLLMDNEPKALKVRRLTRANTEELEGLFQALEKQLNDRNLIKSKDGRLVHAESQPSAEQIEQAQAISDLTKEIEDFTSGKPEEEPEEEPAAQSEEKLAQEVEEDPNYDWGPNPVKHHLKRKTVYLPSTKELEARFRSLERQIKLLEDVEKIDVEQRLNEIERKIKLQYSLSHEKDLNKYIELCEGKGLDDDVAATEPGPASAERSRSPNRKQNSKSTNTSPVSKSGVSKSPYVSPSRKDKSSARSPFTSPSRQSMKPQTSSPTRSSSKKSPFTSPSRQTRKEELPISQDLEYKYRVLDLVRSKSKENLAKRKMDPNKKPPIHPLEMLLDPSPDDSEIPTTGELEHRIRLLDEKLKSPARHRSRSRSPTIEDIKRKKMLEDQLPKSPVHSLERLVYSPDRPEPPTAEELDRRILALEKEQRFDMKTQKDYKEFNRKLKDVISPSLSYEEFKLAKSREQSPRRQTPTTPKSAIRRADNEDYRDYHSKDMTPHRPTSPKVIRFRDEDDDYDRADTWRPRSRQSQGPGPTDRMVGITDALSCMKENSKILERILKKTLADQPSASTSTYHSYGSSAAASASCSEGLDELGCRLMRETSPITRTGTHTGVPLRTGDNINERLSSIKNSIKSIDNLCEEKSYHKEKCQRYIDSLFSDSLHFSHKKGSAEDLVHSRSESRGRGTLHGSDCTPAIRIGSEHRSLGSEESVRAVSPDHHRSHRDISRELSPHRRRATEDLEERESSRVRSDNLLPNYSADNRSDLSSCNSLTKFHKVDRQLEETCAKYADDRRSACESPLNSPYETRTSGTSGTPGTRYNTSALPSVDSFPRPVSPYRQPYDSGSRPTRSIAPVYQPAKLEIRHTTVTSTFYDRFLTEKQIEKQTLSRAPSRSPVLSPVLSPVPSAVARSYNDLPSTLGTPKYANEPLLQVSTSSSYSPMSRSFAGTNSTLSYLASSIHTADAAQDPQLAPLGGSASDLRLRFNYESISMPTTIPNTTTTTSTSSSTSINLTPYASGSVTAAATSSSSAGPTGSAFNPLNYTSSISSRLGDQLAATTAASSLSSSIHSYSTGVYNPMMTFTLREPLVSSNLSAAGSQSPFQLKSSYSSSYTPSVVKNEPDKP